MSALPPKADVAQQIGFVLQFVSRGRLLLAAVALPFCLLLGRATLVVVVVVATIALTSETSFSETLQCRTSPGAAAPPGTHWYYRVDRTNNRHCWYTQAAGLPVYSRRNGMPSNPTLHIARERISAPLISAPLQTDPTELSQLETAKADSTDTLTPSVDEPTASVEKPTANFTTRWSDLPKSVDLDQDKSTTRDNDASEPAASDSTKPGGATFGKFDDALALLRSVLARTQRPVYGVLGNHDTIRMVPDLEVMGIRMLINECEPIERGGAAIYLAGIDDAHYFHARDIETATLRIPREAFSVLLSHTPEVYHQATVAGFDLLLSGHTHGGQICLPGSIPITLRAVLPRRFGAGAWKYREMAGYTSTGVGSAIAPMRFNCLPEITLHRLWRMEEGDTQKARERS